MAPNSPAARRSSSRLCRLTALVSGSRWIWLTWSSMASRSGPNGACSNCCALPARTSAPERRAESRTSRTRRVLPLPPSPSTWTIAPSACVRARCQSLARSASSASRPMSGTWAEPAKLGDR